MKILIVDGSVAIIERLKDAISEINYALDFFSASSGNNAIQIIEKQRPTIAILDNNLPDKLSFNLIKYLKLNHANTFIILLSSQPEENVRNKTRAMGANVFLDKYHEFEKIPGIIKAYYQDWCFERKNLKMGN